MTAPRGADLLAQTLKAAGVERIFTLSGNHIMPVFDACLTARIELIHVRHEAAAVHMADAYARLTGRPAVALVTGGPGHANAVGALYTALMCDSPVVLLSGHAPHGEIGRGAFQEMRQADMAEPTCKASWTATSADSLGQDMTHALGLAAAGRPGPVHLSVILRIAYIIRSYTTEQVRAKGVALGERLYVPEQFNEATHAEAARRRRDRLGVLRPHDGVAPLAVALAEFKGAEACPGGYRIWLKHMPDAPLLASAKTWERIARTYAAVLEARDADHGQRVRAVLTALIRARREHTYEIDTATLLLASDQWIPVEGVHELPLLQALVDAGRITSYNVCYTKFYGSQTRLRSVRRNAAA